MIDWARIDTLREEVGADCFDEIVELFLEEVDEGIARLRAGPPDDSLGPELHFLKGCALNLGFAEFSELCEAGEGLCNAGQAAQVDLPGILGCYDTSRDAFLSTLKSSA